ncbi:MAG TPA: hypothetical protein VE546_05180 [Streptomyces sp.]|uniref:hypothetical protein n=1 Tax=Streptomyces sp. TaxID=1931 RepID=UPI002D3851D8|nr:hypothetical protein [Streptomyces sp.]HZG02955.1 hypothetical protein [Streptomyces sp.]
MEPVTERPERAAPDDRAERAASDGRDDRAPSDGRAERAFCVRCGEPTDYPAATPGATLCPVCEWQEAERIACSC